MVTASDIVGEATGTNNFLEEMRRLHKARLRTGIRNLEDKMINLMSDLDSRPGGKLEGIKINLKQSQKIHAKMVNIFEEEYGQTVSRMVGEYGQIAQHIKRSWRSLGESVQFTDVDKAMLTSLQGQAYDQFSVFGEAAQRRMADAMYSSVVAGASYAQLLKTVKGILRGHTDVRGRSMLAYADTHSFDAIMNFHNDVNVKKSEDLGIKKFMYVGDIITTTRPFCRRRAGKLYTRAQIDRWNTLSWSGKSGPPFTHRGGYNCRHHWRGMKDDWVDMTDEVEEGIQDAMFPVTPEIEAVQAKIADSKIRRAALKARRQGIIKERRGLRTNIKGETDKVKLKTMKGRLSGINRELKVISGERDVLMSEAEGLKVELKTLRDNIRKLPPQPEKVVKPKPAPKLEKVIKPTPPTPPPKPIVPPAPKIDTDEIKRMKANIKKEQADIKELKLIRQGTKEERVATAKLRGQIERQLAELEEDVPRAKAIRKALEARLEDAKDKYHKLSLRMQESGELERKLKRSIKEMRASISSTEFAAQRAVASIVEAPIVTGTTAELQAEYIKYRTALNKLVRDNPQKYVDYKDWNYVGAYERSLDPIKRVAYALNQKEFEAKMNWYRSLSRSEKLRERRMTIDAILRRNNVTKYKSTFTKGTDHLSFRMLEELNRHGLKIEWHTGLGRGSYYMGRVKLYRGNTYTTVAHELAHAIDSLCAKGFKGDWGYTGFVWKNDCAYTTKKMRQDLRKWYKSHQSGKYGTYYNGDGRYFKNDWIDDYEGRIYERPLTNVSGAGEAQSLQKSFGQEWWSMNIQRYNETVRRGIREWESEVEKLTNSIIFGKRDIARYGPNVKLSSNIDVFEAQLKKLNRPGEMEAYVQREIERGGTWQKVRRIYPNLAAFIEDFFSTITAT